MIWQEYIPTGPFTNLSMKIRSFSNFTAVEQNKKLQNCKRVGRHALKEANAGANSSEEHIFRRSTYSGGAHIPEEHIFGRSTYFRGANILEEHIFRRSTYSKGAGVPEERRTHIKKKMLEFRSSFTSSFCFKTIITNSPI